MSCIIVPSIPSDGILDVAAVAKIQAALATDISWLDTIYGIAEPTEMKKDDGSLEIFPRVYSNLSSTPKEYYDVRYDDSIKAQVFFERNSQNIIGSGNEFDECVYDLSIVCWANLNKVDSTRTTDFTANLAGHIIKCLRDNFLAEVSDEIQIELRSKECYSKYSLSDVENRFLTLPYTAFKISFKWTEYNSAACYAFVSGGSNPC